MLSALRSVRFESPEVERSVVLMLEGCPLDQSTLAALAGLPEWGGSLDLSTCTWPLESEQYRQLASVVPASYTVWKLGDPPIITEVIIDAVKITRQRLGLPQATIETDE